MSLDEAAACPDSLDFCGIGIDRVTPMLPDYWHSARNRVLVAGTSPSCLSMKPVGAQLITGLRDLASNMRLARLISEPTC